MEPKYCCHICLNNPNAHSFGLIDITQNDTYIFYTCPSQATMCSDVDGIRSHYSNTMLLKPTMSRWRWIFDASGFDINHMSEVYSANAVCDVINQHAETLDQILIVNETWFVRNMLEIIKYSGLLYPNVLNKIVFRKV